VLRDSEFERAGELFYEAAGAPELWPDALQALGDACGAIGAVFFPIVAGRPDTLPSPGIEWYIADLVEGGWNGVNSRMQRGLQLTAAGVKGFITDADMFAPAELAKDMFYKDFIEPRRMGATAGMVLARHGTDFALPISMERRAADGPFLQSEVLKMNRLATMMRPAAELALKVGLGMAQKLADSFGAVGKDIVLLSGIGRVLHTPPGFDRHIGDAFTLRRGFLSSWHAVADHQLSAAISRALAKAPAIERVTEAIALPRRSGRRPLTVQVVPITGSAHDVFILARALLIVNDPDDALPDPTDTLAAAFGLTPAEARLARRIGTGEKLTDAAEAEGIALETARTRLKAIFAKTDTHRQAELTILVSRLVR
jgi:DNA-binding CsgD family transcriptional regulator